MKKECFNCGKKAVKWLADYDFKDYGLEGDGIIHELVCENCGARIRYEVKNEETGD